MGGIPAYHLSDIPFRYCCDIPAGLREIEKFLPAESRMVLMGKADHRWTAERFGVTVRIPLVYSGLAPIDWSEDFVACTMPNPGDMTTAAYDAEKERRSKVFLNDVCNVVRRHFWQPEVQCDYRPAPTEPKLTVGQILAQARSVPNDKKDTVETVSSGDRLVANIRARRQQRSS